MVLPLVPIVSAVAQGKKKVLIVESNDKEESVNKDKDTRITEVKVNNYVSLSRSAKVAILPKFLGKLKELKMFLAKLGIYINYNLGSFPTEVDKVLFAILYLEG